MNHPFIRTVVHRPEAASTSDLAREMLLEGGPELPILVRADRQTKGRGRGSHTWWSDDGSLTFTLAVDPAAHGLKTSHEPRLALATAVAIIDAVGPMLPGSAAPMIRWPNDVEVDGRKLAGLLPERINAPSGVRLLIGIGLNVRTRFDDAPEDVQRLAVSLADLTQAPPAADAVLAALLDALAAVLPRLAGDDPTLVARWSGLDSLLGQPVRIDLGPRVVEGVGQGIDSEGALLVATATETLRLFGGQVLRG